MKGVMVLGMGTRTFAALPPRRVIDACTATMTQILATRQRRVDDLVNAAIEESRRSWLFRLFRSEPPTYAEALASLKGQSHVDDIALYWAQTAHAAQYATAEKLRDLAMAALSCRGELFVSVDDFAAIAKAWGRDGDDVKHDGDDKKETSDGLHNSV